MTWFLGTGAFYFPWLVFCRRFEYLDDSLEVLRFAAEFAGPYLPKWNILKFLGFQNKTNYIIT